MTLFQRVRQFVKKNILIFLFIISTTYLSIGLMNIYFKWYDIEMIQFVYIGFLIILTYIAHL